MHIFKKQNSKKIQGFTIIELLVATVVFSIVLVVILAAFIQVSRLFYKGVNMANTQNATRTALTSIGNDIQFARALPTSIPITKTSGAKGTFCVGQHLYSYNLGYQLQGSGASSDYIFKRYDISGSSCTGGTNPTELMAIGTQLNEFDLACGVDSCTIHMHAVFYGGSAAGLFHSVKNPTSSTPWNESDALCTGALTSSQYCAVADFSKTVLHGTD